MTHKRKKQVNESKDALLHSLLHLMKEKPFYTISITEISDLAQFDRRTFYRHFSSKEDVLDYHIHNLVTPYLKDIQKENILSEYDLTYKHFYFLQNNLSFLKLLKKQHLFGFLLERYNKYMLIYNDAIPNETEFYRLAFKSGGLINVVSRWIDKEPLPSPEAMATMIDGFIDYGLNFEKDT